MKYFKALLGSVCICVRLRHVENRTWSAFFFCKPKPLTLGHWCRNGTLLTLDLHVEIGPRSIFVNPILSASAPVSCHYSGSQVLPLAAVPLTNFKMSGELWLIPFLCTRTSSAAIPWKTWAIFLRDHLNRSKITNTIPLHEIKVYS